jgi:hypothetical protein
MTCCHWSQSLCHTSFHSVPPQWRAHCSNQPLGYKSKCLHKKITKFLGARSSHL